MSLRFSPGGRAVDGFWFYAAEGALRYPYAHRFFAHSQFRQFDNAVEEPSATGELTPLGWRSSGWYPKVSSKFQSHQKPARELSKRRPHGADGLEWHGTRNEFLCDPEADGTYTAKVWTLEEITEDEYNALPACITERWGPFPPAVKVHKCVLSIKCTAEIKIVSDTGGRIDFIDRVHIQVPAAVRNERIDFRDPVKIGNPAAARGGIDFLAPVVVGITGAAQGERLDFIAYVAASEPEEVDDDRIDFRERVVIGPSGAVRDRIDFIGRVDVGPVMPDGGGDRIDFSARVVAGTVAGAARDRIDFLDRVVVAAAAPVAGERIDFKERVAVAAAAPARGERIDFKERVAVAAAAPARGERIDFKDRVTIAAAAPIAGERIDFKERVAANAADGAARDRIDFKERVAANASDGAARERVDFVERVAVGPAAPAQGERIDFLERVIAETPPPIDGGKLEFLARVRAIGDDAEFLDIEVPIVVLVEQAPMREHDDLILDEE